MKIYCALFSLIISIILVTNGFSQKLKKDGYKITIQESEIGTKAQHGFQPMPYFIAKVKVKSRNSLKGNYLIIFQRINDSLRFFTVKDFEKKEMMHPRLYYSEMESILTYGKGTSYEGSKVFEDGTPLEEVVLEGTLIWLKIVAESRKKQAKKAKESKESID